MSAYSLTCEECSDADLIGMISLRDTWPDEASSPYPLSEPLGILVRRLLEHGVSFPSDRGSGSSPSSLPQGGAS
jgi:hypothetical protein